MKCGNVRECRRGLIYFLVEFIRINLFISQMLILDKAFLIKMGSRRKEFVKKEFSNKVLINKLNSTISKLEIGN